MPEVSNPCRSTGPRTEQGKARSSQNATKHGACSQALLLPDEDPEEQQALFQMWLDDYNPTTGAAMTLIRNAATAQWLLLRQRRRYHEAEQCNYAEQPDPMHWTPEQHKRLQLFTRYLTTAERRFKRAFAMLESLRHSRVREELALRRVELQAAEIALKRERLERSISVPDPQPCQDSFNQPAHPSPSDRMNLPRDESTGDLALRCPDPSRNGLRPDPT